MPIRKRVKSAAENAIFKKDGRYFKRKAKIERGEMPSVADKLAISRLNALTKRDLGKVDKLETKIQQLSKKGLRADANKLRRQQLEILELRERRMSGTYPARYANRPQVVKALTNMSSQIHTKKERLTRN